MSISIKNHLPVSRICLYIQSVTGFKGQISRKKRASLYGNISATLLIIVLASNSCNSRQAFEATAIGTATAISPLFISSHFSSYTEMPPRTPTHSPIRTPMLATLTVTVWPQEPLVPILLYHYFIPNEQERKEITQIHLDDFRIHLEKLFNAGYSLIQVEEWLQGNMVVPPGRRPLAITMDDLFHSSQLEFDAYGHPSPNSGLGVLWQFSQEHPDFGFEVILFANFGAQLYGVKGPEDRKLKQAAAAVWCIEHGARIYNHTFSHIDLQYATEEEFAEDLRMHDAYLRELLDLAGRKDLIYRLGSMLAVPYSYPLTSKFHSVVREYTTPEGLPMQAVFGSAYFQSVPPLQPPYTPDFDSYSIMRFEVNNDALNYLVRNKDNFTIAQSCTLDSLEKNMIADPAYLSEKIAVAVNNGTCPFGIYVISGLIFDARAPEIVLLFSGQ